MIEEPLAMNRWAKKEKQEQRKIAFVPTMGCLHEGHLSLIRHARTQADRVVVSIFVNPLQFGKNEDFDRYPKPFARDFALCERLGVDVIFHPDAKSLYPRSGTTLLDGGPLTKLYCGKSRPGHFNGMLTVVATLFHLVNPDLAYFGEKDFQQLFFVRRMVQDLWLDIGIVPMPTIRESDGLALSSRNLYLNAKDRYAALALHRAIEKAKALVSDGIVSTTSILNAVNELFDETIGVRKDFAALVDTNTLRPLGDTINRSARLLLAGYVGQDPEVRLIDNSLLTLPY